MTVKLAKGDRENQKTWTFLYLIKHGGYIKKKIDDKTVCIYLKLESKRLIL